MAVKGLLRPAPVVVDENHALCSLRAADALQNLYVIGEVLAVVPRVGQRHDSGLGAVWLEDGDSGIWWIHREAIRALVFCPPHHEPVGWNLADDPAWTIREEHRLGRHVIESHYAVLVVDLPGSLHKQEAGRRVRGRGLSLGRLCLCGHQLCRDQRCTQCHCGQDKYAFPVHVDLPCLASNRAAYVRLRTSTIRMNTGNSR